MKRTAGKVALFLLLSAPVFAGKLDLPGTLNSSYDYRLTGERSEAVNADGRFVLYAEQGFTLKGWREHFLPFVAWDLYAPNMEVTDNNYIVTGVRNSSLLEPFSLSFSYESPINQTLDTKGRWVFSIQTSHNWNLAE